MKKVFRVAAYVITSILILWTLLTLWVEGKGPAESLTLGDKYSPRKVLIVYDPDPIYNLDKQVCLAFAETLKVNDLGCTVATVAAASQLPVEDYDAYVFCANTYNWRPDWAVTTFIENADLKSKRIIALTVGAGSTEASQRALEKIIINRGGKLLHSQSLWLLKPNDEERMQESNIEVAKSLAHKAAQALADNLLHGEN